MNAEPFGNLPEGSSLMVAFSGGVDSSVATHLCREAGYKVHAVFMSHLRGGPAARKKAAAAADVLGVPLDFLELADEFETEIMHPAWEEYARGRTPNPCARCNPLFKFGRLIEYAKSRDCSGFVTGHYARILHEADGSTRLLRGACTQKDQSYFLFGLSPRQLAFSYLPLGLLEKIQVREIARGLGLPNADAPESQDACFAPQDGTPLAEMLRRRFQAEPRKGDFLASDGTKLGPHNGMHAYTIGQRKGMGVALGAPAYVRKIDAASGNIVLTVDQEELFSDGAVLENPNWLRREYAEKDSFSCDVRIRYRSRNVRGTVTRTSTAELAVRFDEPQRAVTPGQAAVFYEGDEVIGGAWIQSAEL